MKTILATFLTVLLLPVSAFGDIQTITHTVKQAFGGSQSADDALISAMAKAKREALEMAGVYVEALTIVKDSKVDKDEILALAAGVLKTEVVSQKNYITGEAFGIEVVVKIIVDTSVLEIRVKKLLQDRAHLDQLNLARKKEKELLDKMAILEKENRRLMAKKESSRDLKKQFQETSRGLTAVDWVDIASALFVGDKFTDPQKAIECLNEAIRLKPDYAVAYYNRGGVYYQLRQYDLAIEDYNKAIRLTPNFFRGYLLRSDVHVELKQYQRAIEDYNEAIRLKPDYALAYSGRGITFGNLDRHQRAIEDFNEAIRLKPDDWDFFYNRGNSYMYLKQFQRAIDDFTEAIRLRPDFTAAYHNRGLVYMVDGMEQVRGCSDLKKACSLGVCKGLELVRNDGFCQSDYNKKGMESRQNGNHLQAISYFSEAIRLKPDDAFAYDNRGALYLLLDVKSVQGCYDLIKACDLGVCKGLEIAKRYGYCR